jgi:hypothetical protein
MLASRLRDCQWKKQTLKRMPRTVKIMTAKKDMTTLNDFCQFLGCMFLFVGWQIDLTNSKR